MPADSAWPPLTREAPAPGAEAPSPHVAYWEGYDAALADLGAEAPEDTDLTDPVEPHTFAWHPLSAREQLAGTGNGGSASCSCGKWSEPLALDNRAGRQSAESDHAKHAIKALHAALRVVARQARAARVAQVA